LSVGSGVEVTVGGLGVSVGFGVDVLVGGRDVLVGVGVGGAEGGRGVSVETKVGVLVGGGDVLVGVYVGVAEGGADVSEGIGVVVAVGEIETSAGSGVGELATGVFTEDISVGVDTGRSVFFVLAVGVRGKPWDGKGRSLNRSQIIAANSKTPMHSSMSKTFDIILC
jgi:hypothetical protein